METLGSSGKIVGEVSRLIHHNWRMLKLLLEKYGRSIWVEILGWRRAIWIVVTLRLRHHRVRNSHHWHRSNLVVEFSHLEMTLIHNLWSKKWVLVRINWHKFFVCVRLVFSHILRFVVVHLNYL